MLNSNYKSSIQPRKNDHVFSRVPKNNAVEYSTFKRDHRYLTAINTDYLYPILIDEVVPGDIFKCKARHLGRLLTPIHPFMDNLKMRTFYFYVPTRLVWNNTKYFYGEKKWGNNDLNDYTNNEYQIPMLNSGETGVEFGSIFDYAGIPPGVPNLEFSAIPFRGINLVRNEFFMDQNIQEYFPVGGVYNDDGTYNIDTAYGDSDDINHYKLFKITKAHDYFTSMLPMQQLGEPVTMPLSPDPAPVVGTGETLGIYGAYPDGMRTYGLTAGHHTHDGVNSYFAPANPATSLGVPMGSSTSQAIANTVNTVYGVTEDPNLSGLQALLNQVTGFSINDFRILMQLQALKELSLRGGHRYREYIKNHFNVSISDARIDIPEYLGGYTVNFNTIPVASTSGNNENPQGNLSAFSVTDVTTRHAFSKAFEEPGYVIGLCAVVSDNSYQQGLQRFWSRKNLMDFYDPYLANISEQAVNMRELLAQGNNVTNTAGEIVDETVAGYQEAWADMRFKPNLITGKMRSTAPDTLDVWHLAQELEPTIIDGENVGVPLNEDFIESNTPIERVLAVTGTEENPQPAIYLDTYFDYKCTREMPLYSVPSSLIGRL